MELVYRSVSNVVLALSSDETSRVLLGILQHRAIIGDLPGVNLLVLLAVDGHLS